MEERAETRKMTSNQRWKKLNSKSAPTTSVITRLCCSGLVSQVRAVGGWGVRHMPVFGRQVHAHEEDIGDKVGAHNLSQQQHHRVARD